MSTVLIKFRFVSFHFVSFHFIHHRGAPRALGSVLRRRRAPVGRVAAADALHGERAREDHDAHCGARGLRARARPEAAALRWCGCIASITTGGDAARGLRGRRVRERSDGADLTHPGRSGGLLSSPIDDCGYHEGDGNNEAGRDYNNKVGEMIPPPPHPPPVPRRRSRRRRRGRCSQALRGRGAAALPHEVHRQPRRQVARHGALGREAAQRRCAASPPRANRGRQ